MKIAELFEQANTFTLVVEFFGFDFSNPSIPDMTYVSNRLENLSDFLKPKEIDYDWTDGDAVQIEFKGLTSPKGIEENLEKMKKVINTKFQQPSVNFSIYHARFSSMPAIPFNGFEYVQFDHPVKVTNIAEIFPDAHTLKFFQSNYLTGGVLGLFKLKKLKRISAEWMNDETKKVFDIVNKALSSGRNASACQTELMKNGLKEYAKL